LKVLDRLDLLGNAIGAAASPVIKFAFRGVSKVITISTRTGIKIIECVVDGSKYSFRALDATGKAFGEVNWNPIKEVVYYGLDGRTYKQKVWCNDGLESYIYRMKEILKDEEGDIVASDKGERLAVFENASDPKDTKTMVIEEAESTSYDDILDPNYGKPFYAIFKDPSDELVKEFNLLTSTAKSDFLIDFEKNPIKAILIKDNPRLIECWDLLKADFPRLKLDETTLRQVRTLLDNSAVQRNLGSRYKDELLTICKAQGFTPRGNYKPNALSVHLESINAFFTKFDGKNNMAEMVKAMKNSNENVQDGLQFVLNQMNHLDARSVKSFDLGFEGEGLPCTNCRFDVELNPSADKPLRYIEYKSYHDASQIQLPQFKNYVSSVKDLSEMKYIFNSSKLPSADAMAGMEKFIKKNKAEIFDTMSLDLKDALEIKNLTDLTDTKVKEMVSEFVTSL